MGHRCAKQPINKNMHRTVNGPKQELYVILSILLWIACCYLTRMRVGIRGFSK